MSNKDIPFGIDLGTTNVCGAVWWNDKVEVVSNELGSRTTPSYYYFDGVEAFVGKTAQDKIGSNPANVYYDSKRLLAQKFNDTFIKVFKSEWTFDIKTNKNSKLCEYFINDSFGNLISTHVSGGLLKNIKESAERRLACKMTKCVITVPAYFNTDQKKATLEAAKWAKLDVIRIITEPTAAAIAYGVGHKYKINEKLFVFDLGGGTFDVTIMQINDHNFQVKAVGGDSHLGGRDFDSLIVRWMKEKLTRDIGKKVDSLNQKRKFKIIVMAQNIREALSVSETTPVNLSDIHEEARECMLKRSEFESMSEQLLKRLQKSCEDTLGGAKLSAGDIDHVLFVGGASRMPTVTKMLQNIFHSSKFSKVENPDEVVAAGATMFAASLLKASKKPEISKLIVREVLPLSIGIEVAGGRFQPILQNNTEIPSKETFVLSTSEDNQRVAFIPIYEGISDDISKDKHIADIEIPDLPLGKAGTVKAELTLSIEINGMLRAVAKVNDCIIPLDIEYSMPWDRVNTT